MCASHPKPLTPLLDLDAGLQVIWKTGWSGAIRAKSSSEAWSSTPKNFPVSRFHRRRYALSTGGLPAFSISRAWTCAPLPDPQLCFACRTEVAHPLRVPAWRNQVSHATDLHRVYRNFLHLPGLAPAYREHMRATDAEPQLRQPRNKRVDEA